MFLDRHDAGRQLAERLASFKDQEEVVVIALPRGGIPVAYEVAKALNLPLNITYPRKIGAPINPELAIGAITETGEGVFHRDLIDELGVSEEYIKEQVAFEQEVSRKRLSVFRKYLPECSLEGKTVILIDDGIATGATMEAAIISIRKAGAARIIIAVPVAPPDTITRMKSLVDEIECLATPVPFFAIGAFYDNFNQTEEEEIIELLKKL